MPAASERTSDSNQSMRRADEQRLRRIHLFMLALGAAILLSAAFSGYVWFDESYTLAIVTHNPADIWRIGAADVHPVLYYEVAHTLLLALDTMGNVAGAAAHALGLDPGASLGPEAPANLAARVLGLRLFSIAGAWATALLGRTHVSRDYGPRAGLLFSLLVLFAPILVELSSQIRMYSWAIFAVALCCIYGLRIARQARQSGQTEIGTWTIFALSSLAAAYLHYYGALTAFALNALLLICLLRLAGSRRAVKIWALQAALQVAAYLPWLVMAIEQVSSVRDGFWITLDPLACIVPFGWPLAAATALRIFAGPLAQRDARQAAAWGIAVYGFVLALVIAASLAMGHPIVIERYLAIPLVPTLLSLALLPDAALRRAAKVRRDAPAPARRRIALARGSVVACAMLLLVATGIVRQVTVVRNTYGQDAALALLDQAVSEHPSAPVISDSINIAGVVAATRPQLPITFANPYGERTARAYEAFAPAMRVIPGTLNDAPTDDKSFIYLTANGLDKRPKTRADLARKAGGATIREVETIERPHEGQRFYIAIAQHNVFDGPCIEPASSASNASNTY